MPAFKIPLGPFKWISEIYAKPNWEEKSRTKMMRDFVSENKGKLHDEIATMILKAADDVYKHEYRMHQRCRVKKPEDPIHPKPYFVYDGYWEALECLLPWLRDPPSRYDVHTRNLCLQLHRQLWHWLEIWKSMGTDVEVVIRQLQHRENMKAMEKHMEELEAKYPFVDLVDPTRYMRRY